MKMHGTKRIAEDYSSLINQVSIFSKQSGNQNGNNVTFFAHRKLRCVALVKDGAYYCYCAYVLRISRYSGFLSVMLTNTGIFLRGLKLSG